MRPRAARFDAVDEAGAPELIAYLDEQAATGFWRERKAAALDLLELAPGMLALDVGCGTGDDVRAMAARTGRAAGVDLSRALVAEARRRTADGEDVAFTIGDVLALPFADGTFGAVRTERTLQHVADPAAALAEMARVARPGAAIVAIEPDWHTLAVEGEPREVGRAVCARWAGSIANPRVGRELPGLMAAAGLGDVESHADTSTIADLAFAKRQFALEEVAEAAAAPEAVDRWLRDLRERDAAGRFAASVEYVTARGRAPG